MQVLKEKYLTLSIHRQIQVGVVSVSFCVCFLVFLLLALNSFILINLSYNSTTDLLEQRDNQQIELLALYVDNTVNVITEKNKIRIQILRNLIQNYKRSDYISYYKTMNVSKYTRRVTNDTLPTCNISTGCIYYRMLDQDYSNDENFTKILAILTASYPVIYKLFYLRYYDLTTTPIFKNVQFLSNEYKTIFYFSPESEFNTNYELKDFEAQIVYQTEVGMDTYYNVTQYLNNIQDLLNVDLNINNNPNFASIPYTGGLLLPDKNPFNLTERIFSIITTVSLYYPPTMNATADNLLNTNNVIDLLIGDVSSNVIDTFTLLSIAKFNGVKHIISNVNDNLVTPSSCQYLIKFAKIFMNNDTYLEGDYETPFKPADCFPYPAAKEKFNYYYNNKTAISTYKRKVRFPLVNYFGSSTENIIFKFLMLTSPDITTRLSLDSALLFNIKVFIYIVKNQQKNELIVTEIYNHYLAVVFFILLFNLAIWYVVILIISVLLHRFSNSISQPIRYLVEKITSIDQDKQSQNMKRGSTESTSIKKNKKKRKRKKEKENDLDDISFPHDKDIDDLFQIYKVLIKGGFTEDANYSNNSRMRRLKSVHYAYNNISIIKTNNLIIQEDQIEINATSKEYAIFHYKVPEAEPDEYENKITEEKEFEFKNTEKLGGYNSRDSNRKESSFLIEERMDSSTDILFASNSNNNNNNFVPSHLSNFIASKHNKIKDQNNTIKLEKEIIELVIKEEEAMENKSYLYKLCMEITNEGRDIQLITI